MTRKIILLSLLVLNGCQEQTEVSKQDLPSPRSQVKEYVDNLTDADFQESLKKNRRFQPISGLSKYFLFPKYESRPNGGQYIWGDTHADFHRLTLTIKDYSFNNSEQEGEIVFDVGEGMVQGMVIATAAEAKLLAIRSPSYMKTSDLSWTRFS